MRIFYGDRAFKSSDRKYIDFIDGIYEKIAMTGQKRGVDVLCEMHADTLIDSFEGLKRAINKWGGLFRVVFQQYEFNTEKAIEAVEPVKNRIGEVHLQNRAKDACTLLEAGDLDYRALLRKLSSTGYNGPYVLEFTKDIFPPPGREFDYKVVLENAVKDREWLNETARKG